MSIFVRRYKILLRGVFNILLYAQALKKLNLWLSAPKEATSVNYTSATDWKMAVRRDNAVLSSIKSINVYFLNQIRYFSIN